MNTEKHYYNDNQNKHPQNPADYLGRFVGLSYVDNI